MSHRTGKIEILAKDEERVYFKYHRFARHEDAERFFSYLRNPSAYWLDDYEEFGGESDADDVVSYDNEYLD